MYVAAGQAIAGGGSLIVLNETWYKDYDRESFHFFNDLNQWNQMDKFGHIWTGYQLTRLNHSLYQFAGTPKNKSLLLSSIVTQVYLGGIELLDGFSTQWGFSVYDVTSNLTGSALFTFQELLWEEQRVSMSFFYYPETKESLNPSILGSGNAERILKDYNGQSYWLNFNLSGFIDNQKIPKWLDVSIGYGADGMIGGRRNPVFCEQGNCVELPRSRQFYISPGLRLSRIKTKSGFLKKLFFITDAIHFPLPGLQVGENGIRFRGFTY